MLDYPGINVLPNPTDDTIVTNPPFDVPDEDAPVLSRGEETETSSVGIFGIGILALVLGIAVFVLMMKGPEDDQMGNIMLDEIGEPDAEGLPTHEDDNGMLWRRHDDGEMDWWDRSSLTWKRW